MEATVEEQLVVENINSRSREISPIEDVVVVINKAFTEIQKPKPERIRETMDR